MKNIISKLTISLVFVIGILFAPTSINAASSQEYYLSSYDINIIVNENNTFDITETINAYYNVYKHGIYRKLPLTNTVERLDGTTNKNRAKITNIDVNHNYELSKESGYQVIKIGSENTTLIHGPYEYVIRYNYNIGEDPLETIDELYYNIIGNEWDTYIKNVTFTITMPKEFDASKLGFSSGSKYSINSSNITYEVNGNVITGTYNGTLSAGEALTVRLELEEGYFIGAGIPVDLTTYLLFLIPLVCLVISILLWYKYGKDDMVVETVEFYPPSGFNSLEVGFLYNGIATNQDVVSLLIYLANKGYIKITEMEGKSLFSKKKGFKITKLKEYDGNDINEKIFLNGLFTKDNRESVIYKLRTKIDDDNIEDTTKGNTEVTEEDLYNNFYIVMNRILKNINNKTNKHKIFEKSTSSKSSTVIMMLLISLITIVSIPTLGYAGIDEIALTIFLLLFYSPFYYTIFTGKMNIFLRLFLVVFILFHSFAFFSTMPITDAVLNDTTYLIGVIFGIVCIIGMIWSLNHMPKRTPYGNEILGKLRGFKRFLETAEKEQLEAMVMKQPTYFYDILPFTYVLGVSDKWISKFETIGLQAPDWYDSPSGFSSSSFGSFMNSTMASAQSSMSSSPSSGSSGGSSGGGSSGGGSGGGGGGSW